jgi:ketopantoate reductase
MDSTRKPVVVIGLGEMGAVFARGLLRLGRPVYPALRSTDLDDLYETLPDPERVVVAVAEGDLADVVRRIPDAWRDRLVLLQNELLPADFADLDEPTVISVWFEKKPGQEPKIILPSPAYGPGAQLLEDALARLDIPVRQLPYPSALTFELVLKNVYILTTNIAGLRTGGTVGELWEHHESFARAVAGEVIALQEAMTGEHFDRSALIDGMLAAFAGDPAHKCMGRSAPARLARALSHAERLGVPTPTLREIARTPAAT